MSETPRVSYLHQRERLEQCDVEELIEAFDFDTEALIQCVEDAGYDHLIYKAFRYVEGEGNINDNDTTGEDDNG